ncbi:MAG: hypothetical protein IKW58_02500 [Alphaproteobacteria bacterium]|nr:hypothetical protein [Alphaproteobacteria bacterium]
MNKFMKFLKNCMPFIIGGCVLFYCSDAEAWACEWCQKLKDWVVDKASEVILNELGIDLTVNCNPPNPDSTVCLFCPMFKIIFNAGSIMAHKSYASFGVGLAQLLLVFMGVSIALILLKYLSSMGAKDASGLMNDLLKKSFLCCTIFYILNYNYYNVLNLTISPLFSAMMDFAASGSGGSCHGASGIYGGMGGGSSTAGIGGGIPSSIGTAIVCTVENIEFKIKYLFEFGDWAFCRGCGPDRLLFILPHPIFIIDGLLLYIGGIFFMASYPWIMADAVLQLGLAMTLLPFAICGFAFAGTKGYLGKVLQWIINSVFVFVFMSIVIECILEYIGSVLSAALANGDLSDPKLIFTDPNKGIAFWGPNMLYIIFILAIGLTYMPFAKDLAKQLSKGSGVGAAQTIGKEVTGKIDDLTDKAAHKVRHAAVETGKWAGRGIKRGSKAAVRIGIAKTVNTFGTSNGSGKSMRVLGMKFSTEKDGNGRDVLTREWVNPINGRRHVMISDKYSTTFEEYTKSGVQIKSDTKFKHNFMNEHLFDENGDVNVGAVNAIMNSPKALADPRYREKIMTQIAVNAMKKKGKHVGKYYKDRKVVYDLSDPYKIYIEQTDYTGKVTRFAMRIDPATGRMAVGAKVERLNKKKMRKIKNRKRFLKRFGRDLGGGEYAFKSFLTGTVREIKIDSQTGREYYVKTRRRRFLFWKTKTIIVKDTENAEQDGFFDNAYMGFDTRKNAKGKENTYLKYGARAKAGHTDVRDAMSAGKIIDDKGNIADDLDISNSNCKPENDLVFGSDILIDLGICPSGTNSRDFLKNLGARAASERSTKLNTKHL